MTWGDSNKRETISENLDWVQRLSLRDKLSLEGGFTARRQPWRNGEKTEELGAPCFLLNLFFDKQKVSWLDRHVGISRKLNSHYGKWGKV